MPDLITTENGSLDYPVGMRQVGDGDQQYLSFNVSGTAYGINIESIEEVYEYGMVTQVPMTPAHIRGVLNLRGSIVPIIDLSVRFGKTSEPISKKSCVIILQLMSEDETVILGCVVDAVNEVVMIVDDEIKPTPSFGMDVRTEFVSGMSDVNEGFIILLNIEEVFSIEELADF